jgi:hypothetical protein
VTNGVRHTYWTNGCFVVVVGGAAAAEHELRRHIGIGCTHMSYAIHGDHAHRPVKCSLGLSCLELQTFFS